MLDIDDWMISCNKQINQFRKNQYSQFWSKIFNNNFGSLSGPASSNFSEEAKSGTEHQKSSTTDNDEESDLLKFKSQIGVINKLNVTILVAQNLKEDELLNVN